MGDLIVVRHGTTNWDRGGDGKDKIAGHSDIALNAQGRDEARDLGRRLKGVTHIVTSDLPRAQETARLIAVDHPGTMVESDRRLRALHVGEHVGQVTDDKTTRKIVGYAHRPAEAIPGGESFDHYRERVTDGVGDVLRHVGPGPGHVVLVTHGSAATLIAHHLQHGESDMGEIAKRPALLEPGGYVRLAHGKGGWKVVESYKSAGGRSVT